MTADQNKNITQIKYNHLNLPATRSVGASTAASTAISETKKKLDE